MVGSLPAWPQPGEPLFRGGCRMTPEDFEVEELPGWTPRGEGEHLLVEVAKRGANSGWVAGELARRAGCKVQEVGYCGDKDRHAVTRQWFSVRDPKQTLDWQVDAGGEGWRILQTARHDRKLRRGDHGANRFRLRVELDAPASAPAVDAARQRLVAGVANYFGPQRFGRAAGNLVKVQAWVDGARLPGRGPERGRILSSARSFLFNEVLAARIRAGCLTRPLGGDVLMDDAPTGPLWGRGRSPLTGEALAFEANVLEAYRPWCDRLEHAGLSQERRTLLLRPAGVRVEAMATELQLAFELPPGAFATSVLAALGDFEDMAKRGESRDGQ
ncbi:MAG: tRNA pseudouridine(13) synthase TruD [Gammaproteobacteria bacterium]|nr:tRNA pseudouridine(13) synthase TruD [Gammaproteobacteria bacterium]